MHHMSVIKVTRALRFYIAGLHESIDYITASCTHTQKYKIIQVAAKWTVANCMSSILQKTTYLEISAQLNQHVSHVLQMYSLSQNGI